MYWSLVAIMRGLIWRFLSYFSGRNPHWTADRYREVIYTINTIGTKIN